MSAGPERELRTASGAMLYDASCIDQPDENLFEPAAWRARGALDAQPGGRGTVFFIRDGARRWVLRHYRRGGLVAKILDDSYLWSGADATRGFAEFRLLRRLREWDLPVPRAIGARFSRSGLLYRADLVTEELPTRLTLAQALADAPLPRERWCDVGRCIGALHARGVRHADLNAHNLLLGAGDAVFVLDFDRGEIRPRGAWEREVLARLHRSLVKLSAAWPPGRFSAADWAVLNDGVASS